MNLNLGSLGMWLQKNRYALSISAGLACSLCLFYREVQDSEGWCHTVEKSASHQCDNMFPDSSLRDQPDSTCPMCRCAIATTSAAGAAGVEGTAGAAGAADAPPILPGTRGRSLIPGNVPKGNELKPNRRELDLIILQNMSGL